jgi:hypothetical protein
MFAFSVDWRNTIASKAGWFAVVFRVSFSPLTILTTNVSQYVYWGGEPSSMVHKNHQT